MGSIKISIYTIAIVIVASLSLQAQNEKVTSWWSPEESENSVFLGQGWNTDELQSPYHRLPAKAESEVRSPVWNLSKHSAGLSIRFRSNSDNIKIKYNLSGALSMPHMPATGVSGMDLYKKTKDGNWERLWGSYKLDTISRYNFNNKDTSEFYKKFGAEYQLFLPLYNEVSNLEIGVDTDADFNLIPKRKEKPVVVYGTSIAQGACATRPGMAWTNILSRRLDREVINLGFSGNGKMEPALGYLMTDIDAKVFYIDCLPNLTATDNPFLLTINLVQILKEKYPNTPVVLVAHPGFSNNPTEKSNLDTDLQTAITTLTSLGHKRIYFLPREDLGLNFESFVDYVHPNDIGMTEYADGMEKIYRTLFREQKGNIITTQPIRQYRDISVYDWEKRHEEILTLNKSNPPKICLIGDSITHFWGGEPEAELVRSQSSWDSINKKDSISTAVPIRNFGYGWDRVENVLWRVHHGEFDGFNADKIILMIGTNNLLINNENDIADGIEAIIDALKYRQPTSEILILGVLPRVKHERRVSQLNLKLSMFALNNGFEYKSIGNVLLNEDFKINPALFSDGLHPNAKGYELLSKELNKALYPVVDADSEEEVKE
ncbi:MAG: acetylhydrolase [Bacteroidetes bacterium MedPE-SWsnd-G1]|nr:MAG: acetylhydrolase [Bacteroidetes bacterium MedPE-SWsnd-G1]